MLLTDLHGAKRGVPLASLTLARHCLYVLHNHISQGQNLLQACSHSRFGFPPAARRGWDALFALQAIIGPLWPAPEAPASCPAQGSAGLDYGLHMIRGFCHQIENGVFSANHAVALKLAARV